MSMTRDVPIGEGMLGGLTLVLLLLAEVLVAFAHTVTGLILHGLLLITLLVAGAMGQSRAQRRLAVALTLAPLIRMLSLALPLDIGRMPIMSLVVTFLLLTTSWIIMRQLRLRPSDVGLRPGNILVQLMFAGSGLALGMIQFYILRFPPPFSSYSLPLFFFTAVVLLLTTGLTEELIFRGILQHIAIEALGRRGVVYGALVFASMHLGFQSGPDLVFVFAVGLLFGHVVARSRSITGVSLSHGLANVMALLVMPYLDGYQRTSADLLFWLVGGGLLAALAALLIISRQP
jgi:uncharacterized protein